MRVLPPPVQGVRRRVGFDDEPPARSKEPEASVEKERYQWSTDQQKSVRTAEPRVVVQEVHSPTFVEYETSKFQNAYAWAMEHFPRRDLKVIETLQSLDSLIKQQLNAQ